MNEPGHLVAGLIHWKFGSYEVYRVTPPLVHYVAAIPVMFAGYQEDWSGFHDKSSSRPEFKMGEDFVKSNGRRSVWLFTIARWACLIFPVTGGVICFLWSRELWRSDVAGLVSVTLWCFEPFILAHGELVTPDCAATSLGLAASYLFWRWLRQPGWKRALAAGTALGIAELAKMTWIILFGLWPLLWLFWTWYEHGQWRAMSVAQLFVMLLLALDVLNLGYGFNHSFMPLKSFTFVSTALSGRDEPGLPGNRFRGSWTGQIPVPLPQQYVYGFDLQKKDFEDYGQPSYLRGEWKHGGWWHYYLYGLAVKTPHGSQFVFLLAILAIIPRWKSRRGIALPDNTEPNSHGEYANAFQGWRPRDLVILLIPGLAVLVLVSSQVEFNHHVRYVMPLLGFVHVFCGAAGWWCLTDRAHRVPSTENVVTMHG